MTTYQPLVAVLTRIAEALEATLPEPECSTEGCSNTVGRRTDGKPWQHCYQCNQTRLSSAPPCPVEGCNARRGPNRSGGHYDTCYNHRSDHDSARAPGQGPGPEQSHAYNKPDPF